DRFPNGDPTGKTPAALGADIEIARTTLYSLGMIPSVIPSHDRVTEEAFGEISQLTGGFYRRARSSEDAMAIVEDIGRRVFGELAFDRQIWQELSHTQVISSTSPGAPAPINPAELEQALPNLEQKLGASRAEIQASLGRLQKRRILKEEE